MCDRINLHQVNRRALEALIYSGALDPLEPTQNRKQLIDDLPYVIDWAQSRAKDREVGQGNIFDFLGGNSGNQKTSTSHEAAPKATKVADFPVSEKLKLEKEYLGFYVSDHPLKSALQSAQVLSPVGLAQFEIQKSRTLISTIAMITNVKKIITKSGDPMAILQIEDASGDQKEAVVFPRTYEQVLPHLNPDTTLIFWGKVERREEQVQLIVEDAEPLEEVRVVTVELSLQQAVDQGITTTLKSVINSCKGEKAKPKYPVVAVVSNPHSRQLVRLGKDYWVPSYHNAVQQLKSHNFTAKVSTLMGI